MESPVDESDSKSYSQEEFEAALQERLAAAKSEGDTAFKNLWSESKKAKDAARQYEKELKALRTQLGELEQAKSAEKAGIASQDLEKLRAEVRKSMEGEFLPFKDERDRLMGEVRSLKLDNHVKAVMAKSGVRADRINELFKLTADAYDLTDDGQPYLKEHMGTPIDQFILADVRKAYPEWFEGSGSSGSGAAKSQAGGAGGRRVIPVGDLGKGSNLEDYLAGKLQVAE